MGTTAGPLSMAARATSMGWRMAVVTTSWYVNPDDSMNATFLATATQRRRDDVARSSPTR